MELIECRKEIIDVINSVKALVNFDLLVVDSWLVPIINTFQYLHPGSDVHLNTIVGNIIVSNEPKIVRDRTQSKICLSCSDFYKCELACIAGVPITIKAECVGAVVILLRTSQMSVLQSGDENIFNFLNQLAGIFAEFLEKRSLKKKLSESYAQTLKLLDGITDAAVLIDRDKNFICCNSVFSEAFGFQLADIEGKSLSAVLAPFAYEKREGDLKCGDYFVCISGAVVCLREVMPINYDADRECRLYVFRIVDVGMFLNPSVGYELDSRFQRFWGSSESMKKAKQAAIAATKNNLPVLIVSACTIQSRELMKMLSRMTPGTSPISSVVNCTIDPEELEVILFGRAGRCPGLIYPSRNCCVCLSNIHCMPLYLQSRLAEYIDIHRSGKSVFDKVSIYATTVLDLEQLAEDGKFSADLLNLISFNRIVLPDIWDEPQDACYYFRRFLAEFCERYGVMEEFCYDRYWNILFSSNNRPEYLELRGIAERLIIGHQNHMSEEELAAILKSSDSPIAEEAPYMGIEKRLCYLLETGISKTRIANTLGISRATLYRWIDKYGLK